MMITLTLGVVLSIIGSWLRTFINDNFIVALVGQCIAALSAPFFLTAPSYISARWLYPSKRGLYTLLMCLIPFIFACIGPFIASIVVYDPDPIKFKKNYLFYLKIQAIYVSLAGCIGLLLFKQKPKQPPARSQLTPRVPFARSLKLLFHENSFLLSTTSAALSMAGYFSFNMFSFSLLQSKGMSQQSIALIYIFYIPIVIASALFMAYLYKNQFKAKIILIIVNTGVFLILLFSLGFVEKSNSVMLIGLLLLLTALFSPIQGLTLELVADITFPVSEATSSGVVLGAISLCSLIQGLVQHLFLNNVKLLFIILVLTQIVALILIIFIKESNYPRRIADADDIILFNPELQRRPEEEDEPMLY